MPTRREFLRRLAEVSALLPAVVQRAAAIDPAPGSTVADARNVVILMQENRSFDHSFGMLRGVRGFNDPRAVTLPDGKPVWRQTDAKGLTCGPFRLDLRGTRSTWLGSLPHGWSDQTDARNGGNHDRWLIAKPSGRKECAGMPLTMGYYDRRDLPFYYALADAFTVCDQHFCSTLTGTTPNRLHLWTGTIRDEHGIAKVRNSDIGYESPVRWMTYPERLEAADISWRVYQNEISLPSGLDEEADSWLSNFTDNPLEWFEQYHVSWRGTPRGRENPLHERAFTTNEGDPHYRTLTKLRYRDGARQRVMSIPKGDILYRFRKDVREGRLPRVSWIVAPEKFSDHPAAPGMEPGMWPKCWTSSRGIRKSGSRPCSC
jgi:phospholipase C